jgi:phosphopantetheinyl transferase (holo-ACP synthase)
MPGRPVGPVGSRSEFPMIDEIRRLEPLREIIVRRVLDMEEDRHGDHHTVGGREVSYVYPERNGQPVLPMTFSLEMMAEAARLLVPGQVVIAIENVQLMKWLGFDEEFPPTVELSGRVVSSTPEEAVMEMRIRDLGHNPADGEQGAATSVGTVRTAVRYPEPPPVPDFPLTNERPCRVPLDVLYKNLFHGPLFQGTMSLDRFGDEGIQGQVRVLPRHELFRSTTDPQFVLDPVLMDVGMHPLAGWHLEDPDQTGRILLPFEVKEMRFYGPRPAVGTEFTSQGVIMHQSGRRFTHSVDLVGPDGRYWCQMHGLKYWRFYLPFGEFNFHGPKDDYFLSTHWAEALPPTDSDEHGPTAWCVRLEPPRDLLQPGLMMATARVLCTREELSAFRKLTLPDARKVEWLFGRMAAKDAARLLWRYRDGERMVPADIHVEPDEHGRPVASPIGRERPAEFPHVSIAHADGLVVGAASAGRPIGIDLEAVREREPSFEAAAFTESERELLGRFADRAEAVTRFWCAKEATGKALGRGLTDGPRSVIVTAADPENGLLTVALAGKLAQTFPALGTAPLAVHTLRDGNHVVATCLLEEIPACR